MGDEYTAYCFDETCLYIKEMLTEKDEDGDPVNTPVWVEKDIKSNDDTIKWLQGHKF